VNSDESRDEATGGIAPRNSRRRAVSPAGDAAVQQRDTSAAASVAGSSEAACANPSTTRTACGSIANRRKSPSWNSPAMSGKRAA